MLGHGSKSAVASAPGMSRNTVINAEREVEDGLEQFSRVTGGSGMNDGADSRNTLTSTAFGVS
jgi:hypothetical protein